MKKFNFLLMLCLNFMVTVPLSAEKNQGFRQISQKEAKEIMDRDPGIIVVDVRTQDEFKEGHISGAICIPLQTISSVPPKELPDKKQRILVYCRSGRRSKMASRQLAEMGYENILEFGGVNTWIYGLVK